MEWGPIISGGLAGLAAFVAAWGANKSASADKVKARVDERSAVVAGYDTLVNQLQEQVVALAGRVGVLEAQRIHDEEVIDRQRTEVTLLQGRVAVLEAKLRSVGIDPNEVQGVVF